MSSKEVSDELKNAITTLVKMVKIPATPSNGMNK